MMTDDETLTGDETLIDDGSLHRHWFVLHVKPRTEKKVVRYLRTYRFLHHLPLYVKITKVQRRKVRRELPLFPCYVFARLPPAARQKMLQTNLLVRTIPIPNPRETIHELRQIAHAAKRNQMFSPIRCTFKAGELVRVKSGPMRGIEGYVKRTDGRTTLFLNVQILGVGVELSISPLDVERT